MRNVIERLLKSEDSAYKISKKTGVYSSVIQRLRSGEQTIESSNYGNIEKLYEYQLEKDMNVALNQDRYSQYKKNVKSIKNSEDVNFKYKTLKRNNGNIAMALRSTFSAIDIEHDSKTDVHRLIYKMVDLLVLDEGEIVEPLDDVKDIFYIVDKNKRKHYISVVEEKDKSIIYKSLRDRYETTKNVKLSHFMLDISSVERNYLLIVSDDLDDILEFNKTLNIEMIEDPKYIQQIVDRL